jgi:AAA+ ATPase superfamily predicted ATPase
MENRNGADVSDKGIFNMPFLRFWFAFVSPLFKGVQSGDFREIEERYTNRKLEFSDLTFNQLSQELLKKSMREDAIVQIGGYWDNVVDIDILAKTASGKLIAGTCKNSNNKIKKSELNSLKEKCEKAGLEIETFVIVAKAGFSKELKALKGDGLRLLTMKNFKVLLEELDEDDLIRGFA